VLCSAKTKAGTACRARALKNERFCLFHSNSKRAQEIKAKARMDRILNNTDLIIILQRELRKVRRVKNDEFRSGEVRRIVELIIQLKGEKLPASNDKTTASFEERVKRAIEAKR